MTICESCPKRAKCRDVCDAVESMLPKPWTGQEWMFHCDDPLAAVEQFMVNRDAVLTMLAHRDVLTKKQREILDLYYTWGLPQQEIADKLGVRRNTVDEHLARARARILKHVKRKLREQTRKGIVNS